MIEHLIFRLYGPLQSWGDIAVGEMRPSFAYPSKSAVLGLCAAALGLLRTEEEKQRELHEAYGFAVRVDKMGIPLRDYHTTQVSPSKKGRTFFTRTDELKGENLSTILSTRDYRCDAVYGICLWSKNTSPPYSLKELKQYLKTPKFVLYLGRKSCVLSLPLCPEVVPTDTLKKAFSKLSFDNPFLKRLVPKPDSTVQIYWEDHKKSGFVESEHKIQRRDISLSRRRWQFSVREENMSTITIPQSREDD